MATHGSTWSSVLIYIRQCMVLHGKYGNEDEYCTVCICMYDRMMIIRMTNFQELPFQNCTIKMVWSNPGLKPKLAARCSNDHSNLSEGRLMALGALGCRRLKLHKLRPGMNLFCHQQQNFRTKKSCPQSKIGANWCSMATTASLSLATIDVLCKNWIPRITLHTLNPWGLRVTGHTLR